MKRFLTICVLLFAFAVQAGAQNKQQPAITVNGQVVDSNDMPIVGATVYIKDEPGTATSPIRRAVSRSRPNSTTRWSYRSWVTRPSNRYSPRTTT